MLHSLKSRIADLLLPDRRPGSELDRALAEAGEHLSIARRGLAIAVAEEDREASRRANLVANAAELQLRAIEALRGGRDDLAVRAAEAIVVIETEVAASQAASERFAGKAALARREVDARRRRLADLDRGRRLAGVTSALGGYAHSEAGSDPIARAEAALARLETSNADREAVRLEFAPPGAAVADDLADAGFGRPNRVLASDVMARLRAIAIPSNLLPES
jgi:phage shock protein A